MDIEEINKLLIEDKLESREYKIAKLAQENYEDASCFLAQLNYAQEQIKQLREKLKCQMN